MLGLPFPLAGVPRRIRAALVGIAGVAIVACQGSDLAPEQARAFSEAREYRAALQAMALEQPATGSDTAALLSLGYLERARLGLGSPFRLVDFALNDPRLGEPVRSSTAWAILAMVYDREVFSVDPVALDSLYAAPSANTPVSAEEQLERIERAVLDAPDARAGELAVRLAFELAVAERVVRGSAPLIVARAAAQVRDRDIARDDLLRLLRAAADERANPVRLVPAWRMARRFAVERPILEGPTPRQELIALEIVPMLLQDVRAAAARAVRDASARAAAREAWAAAAILAAAEGDSSEFLALDQENAEQERAGASEAPKRRPPLLSAGAAAALAALPQVRAMPPQAPVVVALSASRDRIREEQGVSSSALAARIRFASAATSEEALAAEYARLGEDPGRRVAGALLWAASSMRTYAQEQPWFPSAGGPTLAELKSRFGVQSVSFDAEVPPEWRPYFRRMLAAALNDLERVLPALKLDGIAVHFGRQPLEAALAVHDPRTRTVFIPLGTGPGALAHELAHDLDWQVAARRFGRRGEYSTDQAVREKRGTLASSLRGLTTAALVSPGPENQFRPPHAQRPTEVFATSVDWFVAAALAREGRMNGYLTAVQDEMLTGFAAVRAPDTRGESGEATLAVLGEMTMILPDTRSWFLEQYGRGRELTGFDRARRVLELSSAAGSVSALVGASHDPAFGIPALTAVCVPRESEADDPLARARRRAAELAAESVARRMLAQHGMRFANGARLPIREGQLPPPFVADAAEDELRRTRDAILGRVQQLEEGRSWLPVPALFRPAC